MWYRGPQALRHHLKSFSCPLGDTLSEFQPCFWSCLFPGSHYLTTPSSPFSWLLWVVASTKSPLLWACPSSSVPSQWHATGDTFYIEFITKYLLDHQSDCMVSISTTSVFLPWEPHEQYEKAKRYGIERWTPQVGRCPIYYWRRVEK